MNRLELQAASEIAVEVYGAFIDECVLGRVIDDRAEPPPKNVGGNIDGRPVRLVTISGKGGWSPDPELARHWAESHNVSLLDHLLSVVRGALMFYCADTPRSWFGASDFSEMQRLAHALAIIGFLHDIDKDLQLERNAPIPVVDVAERMERYGVTEFLSKRNIHISPNAMLNYIEEVEGTQAGRTPTAPDYERQIAATCRYIELADKLEGVFTSGRPNEGVSHLFDNWTNLNNKSLAQWAWLEIHDPVHPFLLDTVQRSLHEATRQIAGWLPLVEVVHDGSLICLLPLADAESVKSVASDRFLEILPFGLRWTVNNKLACELTGGHASWENCRQLMKSGHKWDSNSTNLLVIPRTLAGEHKGELDALFDDAGIDTSWGPIADGAGATVKPLQDAPFEEYLFSDETDGEMTTIHALLLLVLLLNHKDATKKDSAPAAACREKELVEQLGLWGVALPGLYRTLADERTRRVVLALCAVATVRNAQVSDPDLGDAWGHAIWSSEGLASLWLKGDGDRRGLADQVKDEAKAMLFALRNWFSTIVENQQSDLALGNELRKHCIVCNQPVSADHQVASTSNVHGIKVSAFSGRTGRNDHLSSPSGDTHLCLVCRAELQLRYATQLQSRGRTQGDLPPLITSPVTTGLFGGLAFQRDNTEQAMTLYDFLRLDPKKGNVYRGLECQNRRIRMAQLESLPTRDSDLAGFLLRVLRTIWRTGRPLHIFSGTPYRHPAIFLYDAMPGWLVVLLNGDSLRLEEIPKAKANLQNYQVIADTPGLGLEWARQLADSNPFVVLGVVCVAWGVAVDRADEGKQAPALNRLRMSMRDEALKRLTMTGDFEMELKGNRDPLVRLAWLATCIQKRCTTLNSTNEQLLCWKTALDARLEMQPMTQDPSALVLGLAGTLEEELTRKGQAAAQRHREGQPLANACIAFATHFIGEVWPKVFQDREPTSLQQRRASAVYRFALLESYKERADATPEADPPPEP